VSANFYELADLLLRSGEREREGLQRTIERMLQSAQVIPLDSSVLHVAGSMESGFGLSAQDSIVLASIVFHLARTKPAESCFLNRNTKDFDVPDVRETLDEYGCKLFGRFDEGLRYIESRLAKSGGSEGV
jgi:hypothetical protein